MFLVSSLSSSGSEFQTVGPATENGRRPSVVCWCAVHPVGNSVRSTVSDDQRYLRQRHSSLSGTLAPGRLWWQLLASLNWTRSATLSQCKYSSCDSPRSYLRVPLTTRAAALSTRCSLSVTDLSAPASTCSSPPGLWQKRGQVSWWTHRPVTIELVEASRNMLYKCWKNVYPGWGRTRISRRAHEHGPTPGQYPNQSAVPSVCCTSNLPAAALINIVLLNDFGKVRLVHNEETGTESRQCES